MHERKYSVCIDGMRMADNMNIEIATLLVRSLFEEYFNQTGMIVSVQEMESTTAAAEGGEG